MVLSVPVPGPQGLPLVGSLPAIAGDPLRFMVDNQRDHGDIVAWRIGSARVVMLCDPDHIEEVLVRQHRKTIKDEVTRSLSNVLGQGLLTADGDVWKRQRKMAAPSFRPRHLATYADTMVRSTRARRLDPGDHDIHEHMSSVTLDIVVRTLFGVEPGGYADRVGELLYQLANTFEHEQRTLWRIIPEWVPSRSRRQRDSDARELDRIVRQLIAAASPDGDDLMARLVSARDDDGQGMTPTELRDAVLTVFLAGHETTALALSYAIWLLAEHPEVAARVHAEIDTVLEGRDATAADSRKLPLVAAVIDETMRLYPPAWVIGREVVEPLEMGGHRLEAGTQIIAPQWVVQRDPRWFVGPSRFRPDRWLNGETADLPRFAYFPFGGGPRVCIGNHFAKMEAIVVLATFLQAAWTAGVSFAPGPMFSPSGGYRRFLRLNCSVQWGPEIQRALHTLGQLAFGQVR